MSDGPGFSIIIPCYNEENGIRSTVDELRENLGDRYDYELIVVDDGSTDGSAKILAELQSSDVSLKVFAHERNSGYGAALKTGIRRASSDLIIITDADGTYPNDRIPELLTHLESADMVVGARTGLGVNYPFLRKVPKLFLRWWVSWIAGRSVPDINSGLRAMKKPVLERFFNILPNGFSFTTTITLAMMTNYYAVQYVPISYHHRIGKSKIRPIKDTFNFLQLIARTGMYFAPLRVLAPLILSLSLATVGAFLYDLFVLNDLTEKTLILFMFTMNTGVFALLADMIDKRNG